MIINWYSFKYNCSPDYNRDESVAEPILHAIETNIPQALTNTDFEKCITLAYKEILQSRSNTKKVETRGETKVQFIGTRTEEEALQDKFAEAKKDGNVIDVDSSSKEGGKKTRKKKMHRTKRRKRKTKRRKRRKRKHKRTRKR